MEDQKRDRSTFDDDSSNTVNLAINGSEKEMLNNMSGDGNLVSNNNNNTTNFNFNTKMYSEMGPGPVPEQIIRSLNGLNPFPIVFDPTLPPPNLGLMPMQNYRGQSFTDGQHEPQNIAVGQKGLINAVICQNQCDSKEPSQKETDPATALQRQADQLKNFGNDHYMAERYSLAWSSYSEAIELYPNGISYYRNRSKCAMMMGNYEGALNDSQMVIALDHKSEDGYNCIIKCCLALGDIDGADKAISKLIEIGSNDNICRRYAERCERLRSLLLMATKCFEKQDFQATVQYVDTALEIAPACAKFKLLKAKCLIHLGCIDDANAIATSCSKSESSNPNASSVDTKYVAGLSACSNGDLYGGLRYFQEAAELDLDQIKARITELKTKKPDVKKYDKSDLFQVEKTNEPREVYIKTPAFEHENSEVYDIEPPDESFNVQLYINRAFVNSEKGNFSNAIADCNCALEISPYHLKALLLRAKCHNEVGNYEGCVSDYEVALQVERTDEIEQALQKAKNAWKRSAVDKVNCLMVMGDYKGALRDGRTAVSLDVNSKEGFECIMKCCLVLGDVDGAEGASKRLNEIDPTNQIRKQYDGKCKQLRTLVDMAMQCFEKKDFQATVDHVDSALQMATACLKLKLMKAECLVHIERVDDGIAIAVSCLEIDPSNVHAFYVVGLCSYYKGDLIEAMSFFQKALDLDSNQEKAKMMLLKAKDLKYKIDSGEKMFEAGKYHVAEKIFTEAIELDSLHININAMLYLHRAKCHNEMKDFMKCVEDYKAALKLNKNREIEQALKEANFALKRQAKFKKNTGDKLFKSKKYSAALPLYNKAIELCAGNAFYLTARSECLIMTGDYKSALKDSQNAVALDKKSKKGYECIIKCFVMLGDIDGAEATIKNLIQIDPNNGNCEQYTEQCKRFRSLVDMAMQCSEKDDFQKSVYHAKCALKIAPACVKIKMLNAENLIHLGRANEANAIVTASLNTDPSNADVVYVAGLCAYYKSDLDHGLIYFQKTLDMEPGHNKAKTMQLKAKNLKQKKENGDHLFKAGKFRDAHKMYTAALLIDSLNSDFNAKLYFNRALMSSKIGNSIDTIADCTKALDLSPNYVKALLLRGKCHNDMNDFREGIKDYESALKISKTSEIENSLKEAKAALKRQADSKKDAGNQQFRSGNYSSALNLYNEAIKLFPNDAIYYRNKSTCLIKMANYTDAVKEGRAAVRLDEKSEKGYECILKCYLALGDIAGAEHAIKRLVEIGANQKIREPYANQLKELRTSGDKAMETFEKKDFKKAVQHIESALKVATACMKYKLMKAECLINVGRFDEAHDIAVLCMLVDPMNTDAVHISGLCSYYKGDLESALTYFQKALVLDPDHIKARIMRFKAKYLKKKKEEALALFKASRFHEAHDIYTESIKFDSSNVNFNAKLHFNRALMTSKMEGNRRIQEKSIIDDTTAALKMTPNYVKAYLLRAKYHNEMENYEQCVKDYEAALKIEKSSETERLLNEVIVKLKSLADGKKNTGDEQYNAGRFQMALLLYNQAIKLFPKYANYYCKKARCLFAMLNYKDALKESQHAVELDDKNVDGHTYIMKCSLILGEVTVAERTMKKLTANDSNNIIYKRHEMQYTTLKASVEMAMECFEKKDFQIAVRHIDDALEIATACTKFKLLKAECLIYLGRYDEAEDIAISCKVSDPQSAGAFYLSGLSSYYKGDLDKGLKNFEEALKMDPDHKKAQRMRLNTKHLKEKKDKGDNLFKVGKFNEAQKMYTEALKVNEMSTNFKAKLLFNRALMDSKSGHFLNSIDDCTKALDLSPKYLKVILLRAKCYSEMENYRECINDYESALKIERTSAIERALDEAKTALEKQSEKKDYYKILGIAKNATDEEIKKAYYKQAKLHHPDKHAGSSRETNYRQEMKFKTIGEANMVLSDPVKRKEFDYSLRKSSF